MIDWPILWESFIHGLRDMLAAVRQMPNWVYILLILAAAVANVLALGEFR